MDDVTIKRGPDGKVTLSFVDTKRTCTIDVSGKTPDEKIAHIRGRILAEGYFYSSKIEKKVRKLFG